jgi:hypothetical protein
MMTRNGLYRMDGACGSEPISVSREKIPESLLNLSGTQYDVSTNPTGSQAYLEWDTRFRCLHIYIEGANAQYFHYFPDTDSFWPVTTPGSGILAMKRYEDAETGNLSGVLVGTADNIKQLDRTAALGGSTLAYATIGPIKLSSTPSEKGMLQEAVFTYDEDTTTSALATLDIYTAESAELVTALPAGRKYSFTVGQGKTGRRVWPKLSGHAAVIKYTQGATTEKFALESVDCTIIPQGKGRNP